MKIFVTLRPNERCISIKFKHIFMKTFLKYLLATILGVFLVQVIIFFIFIGMIAGVSSVEETVNVKPSSVLHMQLNYQVKERTSDNPFEDFSFGGGMKTKEKLGLVDILKNLRKAATDDNIKGIYLDLTSVQAGFGSIEEIRQALLKFKESGKFIVAYSDYYTQGAYYLASVADSIFLNPEGEIEWKGLRSDIMFYKGALEKLGIEPQIVRHGKFKSAIEPFILDKMSDANREQTSTYLGSMWNYVVKNVATSRKVSEDQLNLIADSLLIGCSADALSLKMIDGIIYKDEFFAKLKALSGSTEDYAELITIEKYNKAPRTSKEDMPKDKIAIVYANGQID
ncbi:MAG: signal peptide peptidase SppA, partial [Bacteroidetes bacterium HGW-Bacteroidetes-21]